jgi:N-acyl-D-aspartate/D-glutamate deacylase
MRIIRFLAICSLAAVAYASYQQNDQWDLVILGGRILDGTGDKLHAADIAIQDGRIVEVGFLQRDGRRAIDARGYWVTPGFIDLGSRSSYALLEDGRGLSDLYQGITLAVLGDETSPGPVIGKALFPEPPAGKPLTANWKSLGDYFNRLQANGIALNVASYVSAGQVRSCLMGREDRHPNSTEIQEMAKLVAQSMDEGALGLSNDFSRVPDIYARSEELAELAKVAKAHGGIYSLKLPAHGSDLLSRLQECLRIAEQTKITVEINNLGASAGSHTAELIEAITAAKGRDVDIEAYLTPTLSGLTESSEENIVQLMKQPWMSFGSAGQDAVADEKAQGAMEPACFGAFLRLIGKYARDQKVLTPWEMVYRMTWMPAKHLNLKDRGKIAPGMVADLVIFKPETISDPAAYSNPSRRSTGVKWLIVNGAIVIDSGKYTGARPGRVIRGPGYKPDRPPQ